jgi:hypothetical protein
LHRETDRESRRRGCAGNRIRSDDPGGGKERKGMQGDGIRAEMAGWLARTRFGREAMEEKTDLSLLRARPTARVRLGLGLIGFSYVIGWPAVGLLAWIAYHLGEPLIVAIGGPATYGLSNLVFWVGSWLAGARYVRILLRWATRKVIEKIAGAPLDLS